MHVFAGADRSSVARRAAVSISFAGANKPLS